VGFGLSAESLLRRVGAGIRTGKDVLAAVQLGIFDDLEQPQTPAVLAAGRGLQLDPLADLLGRLGGIGLLLRSGGTYRNSEAASRYLRKDSEYFLGDQVARLVEQAEHYDPLAALGARPAGGGTGESGL
jgi:hypothetical protein